MPSWGDDALSSDEDEPIDPPVRYVLATPSSSERATLVVLSRTPKGWRSRSTSRDRFNHDYLSRESFDDVLGWIEIEARALTLDRAKAAEFLSTQASSVGGPSPTGFLECDPTSAPEARAERVLRHLEL